MVFTPGGQLHPWWPTSSLGANFIPGSQLHPWGLTSPLGTNITPGGLLHPWRVKFVIKNCPLAHQQSHGLAQIVTFATFFMIVALA
jgi:hypothetical protein